MKLTSSKTTDHCMRLRVNILIICLIPLFTCCKRQDPDLVFAFMGDIHYEITDDHSSESLVLAIAGELDTMKQKPDFLMQTGDFFHGGKGDGIEAEAAFAFRHFKENIGLPFFLARGNHDVRNYYEKNALPIFSGNLGRDIDKTYYSFNKSNCHFIFLDCTAEKLDEQLSWLEKDLENARSDSKAQHIFVAGHYPLWIVARAGFTRPEYSIPVASLLARYKVDAYFCGHTHNKTTTVRMINGQPLTQIMDAGVVEKGRLFNLAPFLHHVRNTPDDLARPGILPLEEGHQIFIPASELEYYWGYQEGSTASYHIVTVNGKGVRVDWHVLGEGIKRSFTWEEPGRLTDIKCPAASEEKELTPYDMQRIEKAWLYTAPWTNDDSVVAPFTFNGVEGGLIEISRKKMAGSPFWNKIEVPLTGLALNAINMENEIIFTNPAKGKFGFAHIFIMIKLKDGSFARSSLSEKVITSFLPEKGQYPNFPDPGLVSSAGTGLPLEKVILKFDRFYKNEQK